MSDAREIRKYINVLNEQYDTKLRYPRRFVRIPQGEGSRSYQFYRMSINLANPEEDVYGESRLKEDNIFVFYTEEELQAAIKMWKREGIQYEIMTELDNNAEDDSINTVTPFPTKNPWWGKHTKK